VPVSTTPLRHDPTALVRAHQAGVWRYLRMLGCPAALADDLTQDTFVSVLERPFEDRGAAAAGAYLRRVARNLFWKDRRAAALRPRPAELDELDRRFAAQCGEDGGESYLARLDRCLERLPARTRGALEWHYADRLGRDAIGARLGIGGDGVKSMLRRARELLRECIERSGAE
jgi:RNA polymerase sigma-70 factor (ECF subfamily)